MNRFLGCLGVGALLGVAVVSHLYAFGYLYLEICGNSDTADAVPAAASAQGALCGRVDGDASLVGMAALLASFVVSVALVLLVWRRAGWMARWLSPLLLVALPVLTLWLLSLPADACTDRQAGDRPVADCETRPDR